MSEVLKGARLFWLLMLSLSLFACATTVQQDRTPEEWVMERSAERLEALIDGRLEEAYTFLSPGQRSAVSLLDFQRRQLASRVLKTGFKVTAADCVESACTVQVSLDIRLVGAVPGVPVFDITRDDQEQWILSDGQWWYVPD